MDSIANVHECNSQVPSSKPLLSCPSEPPDLGNWFSSYEYQSPDPDSNSGFEDSALRVSQTQTQRDEDKEEGNSESGDKQLECSGTCAEKAKHNEGLCLNENLDSFSSRSLLSEPPDIRNWFSSYVYESPVSDTNDLLSDAFSVENDYQDERFDYEGRSDNSSSYKNMRGKQLSSMGDGNVEKKEILTTASTSHLEKIIQPCMKDKALLHNFGQTRHKETSGLNHEIPGCNREAHIMSLDINNGSDNYCMKSPEIVQKIGIREKDLQAKIQHEKLDLSTSLAEGFSARSSTCIQNKENDGFVTTRKNRCTNDESSWKKPEKVLLQCSTDTVAVPKACEKQGVTKRKALTEATNVQQYNAIEITGKWKCPQKGKPYLGPALKQLRLEQWVHKV